MPFFHFCRNYPDFILARSWIHPDFNFNLGRFRIYGVLNLGRFDSVLDYSDTKLKFSAVKFGLTETGTDIILYLNLSQVLQFTLLFSFSCYLI